MIIDYPTPLEPMRWLCCLVRSGNAYTTCPPPCNANFLSSIIIIYLLFSLKYTLQLVCFYYLTRSTLAAHHPSPPPWIHHPPPPLSYG